MNTKTILGQVLVMVGAVLMPAARLRAVDVHGLKLTHPVVVDGIYLRAAAYDLQWEIQGKQATLTFARHGRAVATVHGQLATLDRSVLHDTLYVSKRPDGSFLINALGFANSNKAITFRVLPSRPNADTNYPTGNGWMIIDGFHSGKLSLVPHR